MTGPQALSRDEALAWLGRQAGLTMGLGLARMHGLLGLLGRPDLAIPRLLHVAGTNGKGSTARMAAAILQAAGCRTGLYTSPALEDPVEVCRIDDEPPDPDTLAALVAELIPATVEAEGRLGEAPTPFERWTALMYLWCARKGVDVLVQETGLGGRLDATNAAARTHVAAISSIAVEHTDWLGSSLEQIAAEKAAILRPGMLAVTSAEGPALAVVAEAARAKKVPLYRVVDEEASGAAAGSRDHPAGGVFRVTGITTGSTGTRFVLAGPGCPPLPLRCPLPGRHQAMNAALAAAAVLLLARRGLPQPVTPTVLQKGLAGASWPGRLEIWPSRPEVVFDVAHNPHGARALVAALREIFPGRRPVVVCGMLADKDAAGAAAQWQDWPPAHILTVDPENPRAMPAPTLARHFQAAGLPARAMPSLAEGLAEGLALARREPGALLVVTGSFYVVGPARRELAFMAPQPPGALPPGPEAAGEAAPESRRDTAP
ncbi:MAG TPA: Mur ligase family protein [Sphingobacteriaceae bacterium]|nr:Mur ligase family protein [Sphingobacteriaceae bacterium]